MTEPAARERLVRWAIGTFGVAFVALGAWASVHPSSFGSSIADYGARNDHLIHDYAAASIAVGVGLLVAVSRISWRVPALGIATVWNGLHTVSHVVDLDDAASRTLGVVEIGLLAVVTLALGLLAREEAR